MEKVDAMLTGEFYDKHKGPLSRFAVALARDPFEADDLVSETFMRAMTHEAAWVDFPEERQRAWLFKVLRNLLRDRRRRERFEDAWEEGFEPAGEFTKFTEIEFRELLDHLPAHMRDALYSKYWLGQSSRQIGRLARLPDATVRYHVQLALRRLREQLNDARK